jgi:hypothetical protein
MGDITLEKLKEIPFVLREEASETRTLRDYGF